MLAVWASARVASRCGVGTVRGATEQIEDGWRGASAAKGNLFCAHSNVKAFQRIDGEGLAIHGGLAAGANVDDAGFAALVKKIGAQGGRRSQFEVGSGDRAAGDDSLQTGMHQPQFTGRE